MAIFKRPTLKALKAPRHRKREMPQGLWQKCPGCSEVVHEIELTQNQRVCPRCDYHFAQSAQDRLANLLDPESFVERDADLRSVDTLRFEGMATYKDRLQKYQDATGLTDAVVSGSGMIEGYKVAIAVMDFSFLAATMGSVVGERITRTIEFATANQCALVIVSASGGARMYEGMLSLMQMAKTSGALARHATERLPYISVLTNPTTAGVMASFASLGDVILAEPKSMIGFAGPRVIKETTHQELPKGFQTAEFLLEHGLIDEIVHRKRMRAQISQLLGYLCDGAVMAEKPASSVDLQMAPQASPAYRETLAWLYGTQLFGIKLGLDSIRRLLDQLDLPAREQKIIHVAGTNGKGSVCAMIAAICQAQGYRTGLFTSPHLVTYRERIQVDQQMIAPDEVATGLGAIRNLVRDWSPHPTFFEITTALALLHFKEHACEMIVLETGLGGRLDATNATKPIVSVITPIDYDHQKWLGDTLEQIAGEKAGIIKANVPVVSASQPRAAMQVIRSRATECDAPLQVVDQPFTGKSVALAGAHQKQNAALALAALRAARISVSDSAVTQGLQSVKWPARFQRWDDRVIIDGSHNPAGAKVLAETWRSEFGDERATLILSILADKDLVGICEALIPISDFVVLPKIRTERAVAPEVLSRTLSNIAPSLPHSITPSVADAFAVARSRPNRILATGSLHFAGEIIATLNGDAAGFEECAQ